MQCRNIKISGTKQNQTESQTPVKHKTKLPAAEISQKKAQITAKGTGQQNWYLVQQNNNITAATYNSAIQMPFVNNDLTKQKKQPHRKYPHE